MDYKKIIEEQLKETVDEGKLDEIEKQADKISQGFSDEFSLENILSSTLNGESIFDSQSMIESLKDLFLYEIRTAMILAVEIMIICIVAGLLKNLGESFQEHALIDISQMICTMVIAGISISSFQISYSLCLDAVSVMVNTMEILTPVLLGILFSTGAVSSGTLLSPLMIGSVTGVGILIKQLILPILFASTILSLLNCLTEKSYVNKLSKLLRNASLLSTGLLLTVLTGILSIQGLLGETADGLLLNTAKYSLSTFIPIVGGFTSDTVELFLKCMASIKSVVGVFGILTLVAVILIPLIKVITAAVIYKVTAAVAEPVAQPKIAEGLNDVGSCLFSIASILFFTALLFIIFLAVIIGIGGQ